MFSHSRLLLDKAEVNKGEFESKSLKLNGNPYTKQHEIDKKDFTIPPRPPSPPRPHLTCYMWSTLNTSHGPNVIHHDVFTPVMPVINMISVKNL